MLQTFNDTFQPLTVSIEFLALAGLAFGVLLLVFGLSSVREGPSDTVRRMHVARGGQRVSKDFDLILGEDNNPTGLLKAFVPSSKGERTQIQKQLRQAGIQRRNAVRVFYVVRSLLGLIFPGVFLGYLFLPGEMKALLPFADPLNGVSWITAVQIITTLMVLGFYGPAVWLKGRARKRRQAIRFSLPNALDLLQVAIEAGLGFDAAIVRVAHELADVAPELAEELMMLEFEIQAGKERQTAFRDMADRTGLPEVMAFANVILQAGHFGTSVSTALSTFSTEMRLTRELKAQEKANRLPVQMSGIMALFMMPVLLMICLTPMAIRWMSMVN